MHIVKNILASQTGTPEVQESLPPLTGWETYFSGHVTECHKTDTTFFILDTPKGFVAMQSDIPAHRLSLPFQLQDTPLSTFAEAEDVIETWRHKRLLSHGAQDREPRRPEIDPAWKIVWHNQRDGRQFRVGDLNDSDLMLVMSLKEDMIAENQVSHDVIGGDSETSDYTKNNVLAEIIIETRNIAETLKIVKAEAERRGLICETPTP